MLVDGEGNFLVTNDGASLLACLDIEHPVETPFPRFD